MDFGLTTITRPREISSKKPVSRFREVVPIEKKQDESCDPRFDDRAGKFNDDLFKKSYSFIEEMKKNEKQLILKETKKSRNPGRRMKLQRLLQQIVQ